MQSLRPGHGTLILADKHYLKEPEHGLALIVIGTRIGICAGSLASPMAGMILLPTQGNRAATGGVIHRQVVSLKAKP